MKNVERLSPAKDELKESDHPWNRRAQRFLRDMRMLGADNDVVAELCYDILDAVNRRRRGTA